MSTTNGTMKSFKVTDKDGNVYVMIPVDTEARQEIDEAKDLQFDDDYFTSEVSQDQTTVNVGLNGVPLGVDSDSPLKFSQDTPQGIVLGSDAPFATAIAPEYSASSTYQLNESVIYKGKLYIANQDISTAEAWTAAHWTLAKSAPFIAKHGVTPYQKVLDAYNAGRLVIVRASTGFNTTLTLDQYHSDTGTFDFARCYYNSSNNHYMIAECSLASDGTWSSLTTIRVPSEDDYLEQWSAARPYSSTAPGGYSVGTYVTYKGRIYRCKVATGAPAGDWDSSKWDVVQIMDLIGDVESLLAAL